MFLIFGNYYFNSVCITGCVRPDNDGGSRSSRKPAGRFGDYSCDAPWALIKSAAETMYSRQGDNVEFVLWTGYVNIFH